MRKVVLYLGMSLDGYIADENGGVEWMEASSDDFFDKKNECSEEFSGDSYEEFIKTVDTVLMGADGCRCD